MVKLKTFLSVLFVILLIIPVVSFAQSPGKIDGYVKDAKTGIPLPGASIL